MGVEDSLYALREPVPDHYINAEGFQLTWADIVAARGLAPTGFLNMPYSDINPWGCCAASAPGFTTVALMPYTPDARWWYWVEMAAEVRRIPHRVRYRERDGVRSKTPMFPSCIVIWRPQPGLKGPHPPRYVTWDYR